MVTASRLRSPPPARKRGRGLLRRAAALCCVAIVAALAGCGRFAARGLNAQGVRLFDQGQYQAALERFQRAADNDPKSADAYYNLAATYHRLGVMSGQQAHLAQAENYYHRCLDQDPNHRECYRGLAVLLVQEDRAPAAFRLLQNWVNQSPGLADPKIELARLYEEFGDRQNAKNYLLEALAIDHTNPRTLAALGHLREQMGEPAQALENYQRSLAYDSRQPEVAMRVAALQAALNPGAPSGGWSSNTRVATGGVPPRR